MEKSLLLSEKKKRCGKKKMRTVDGVPSSAGRPMVQGRGEFDSEGSLEKDTPRK
jgi:hypothetical protein